jgi:ribosome recycling factor
MNKDARVSIEEVCESLKEIKKDLADSMNTVENSSMRDRIRTEIDSVEKVTKECQDIALGISNHG